MSVGKFRFAVMPRSFVIACFIAIIRPNVGIFQTTDKYSSKWVWE